MVALIRVVLLVSEKIVMADDFKVRSLYSIAAWCLVAAFAANLLLLLDVLIAGPDALPRMPWAVKIVLGLAGAGGAFGFFVLWFGMMWHCSVVWEIARTKKIAWFLLILLTMPAGALLYYFLVFIRVERW